MQKKDGEKRKVIPFPQAQPERFEPVVLFDHPDLQVIQMNHSFYRVRVGQVELTYDCSYQGAWYLQLPGYEQRVKPLSVEQYDPQNQPNWINIDRDQRGVAVGIEVVI